MKYSHPRFSYFLVSLVKFPDCSLIFSFLTNSLLFPCREFIFIIFPVFPVFPDGWVPCLFENVMINQILVLDTLTVAVTFDVDMRHKQTQTYKGRNFVNIYYSHLFILFTQ
jgi:hypothetical protein